jgi:hypothetical protein
MQTGRSDSLQIFHCLFSVDIARIECARGLKQQHMDFHRGHGTVLHSTRHDDELALIQVKRRLDARSVSVIHAEIAVQHQEQFILSLMVMPNELALKLYKLDVLAIELADDFRTPMFFEERQLLTQVYFLHIVQGI